MASPGEDDVTDFTDIGDVGFVDVVSGYGDGGFGEGLYGGSGTVETNFITTEWTDIVRP